MGSDEKVDIPISKDGMDSSESDDMMMLTLSDEASVSDLEDSYVEGDSWSTIDDSDDEDSKDSNMLMLLRGVHSPDESDRLFIFTDEEISPTYVAQEPSDFQKNKSTKVPGGKIVRKMRERLNMNREKQRWRKGARLSSDLSHDDSFSSNYRLGENDKYSQSLADVDQDKSSGSSSAYSDQLLPRKYMIWSRRNSFSSIGLSDSDETYSFETPGFLSKAVKSMRRQRRHRHSIPSTSLLDSTAASLSVIHLDNVEVDSVSSWEDDSIHDGSDKLSVEKHIISLRTLLKNKRGTFLKKQSRKCREGNPSHAPSTSSTVDSASNYPKQDVENENSDRSQQKCRKFARKSISLLERHYRGHLFSESSASSGEVCGPMQVPHQSNHYASLISPAAADERVESFGIAKKKDDQQGKTKTLDESDIQTPCPIPHLEETEWASVNSADENLTLCSYERHNGSGHYTSQILDLQTVDQSHMVKTDYNASLYKEKSSIDERYRKMESIGKEECGRDSEKLLTKEKGANSSISNLDATYVIGWKRVRRTSKFKKKASGGKIKYNRKRGDGEKPLLSCIQSNAVSLQSGTAPWSTHLIRSVTPISTEALDKRPTSRSIAASLGIEQEAEELLSILNESIERKSSRNVDAKEVPKMTCIRMTNDLYIPNFGLYVLQSIQYFKQSLFI